MAKTLYQLLKVNPDATAAEILAAYQRLNIKYHPAVDTETRNSAKKTAEFAKIEEAYKTLSDQELRKQYDASLAEQHTSDQQPSESSAPAVLPEDDDNQKQIKSTLESSEQKPKISFNGQLNIISNCLLMPLFSCLVAACFIITVFYYQDFAHKYTLVSEVLEDTSYYSNNEGHKELGQLKKGAKVEYLQTEDNEKWTQTDYGRIRSKALSEPKNDYINKWWKELSLVIVFLILIISLNLIIARLIASYSAISIIRKNILTYGSSLTFAKVINCVKGAANITRSAVVIPIAFVIVLLIKNQLDTMAVSYAFSGGDNSMINAVLEYYQRHPIRVRLSIFLLLDITISYLILYLALKNYTCPFCGAPFNFFVIDTFETDVHTYHKTEYRTERHNNRDVRVRYTVPYKDYTLHIIKKCFHCGKREETTESKTAKL